MGLAQSGGPLRGPLSAQVGPRPYCVQASKAQCFATSQKQQLENEIEVLGNDILV